MRNGYRVIDVDSHVTPSLEVLHRYADADLKSRWDEFKPYIRTMKSPPGRGHPERLGRLSRSTRSPMTASPGTGATRARSRIGRSQDRRDR